MPARKQGYDAIPVNEDDGQTSTGLLRNNSNNLSGPPPTRWERIKNFEYKRFLRARLGYILCGLVILALIVLFLVAFLLPDNYSGKLPLPGTGGNRISFSAPVKAGISESAMQEGLAKCRAIRKPRPVNRPDPNRKNPRAPADLTPVLLKNAVVWDGLGHVLENVDILLEHGVIKQVQRGIKAPSTATKVIDVGGHVVSPGLVDMHSHLGVYSWPGLAATQDTNEETTPLTPFVRALDAFNPSDKGIQVVASGGVTTALVLPGSGNLMGGEAYAFKLRPVPTTSNEDMLVQAGIDENVDAKWRWMKMACGENPKRVYGSQMRMPMTRLGEAYLFRQRLSEAQNLMRQQDDWCSAAENIEANNKNIRLESRFPEDLSLESLVALLRGDVLLNVHCYETHDIEAMVRHSLEFNFTISAFHHALDAYRIPDIIKRARSNITVATFADHWGYKKEAFQASPFSPKLLHEAGIPVALKSDHPVLNAQHLVFEAAKSSHYGLPPQEAFKAVTSTPAKAIGLDHRIGALKVGYDADIVIWDREPLELGAAPLQVFIDGIPQYEERPIAPVKEKKETLAVHIAAEDGLKEVVGNNSFVLNNAGLIMLGNGNAVEGPAQMVVSEGKILCAATDCSATMMSVQETGANVLQLDAQGGYVIPGLVAVGSKLGMTEIPAEGTTGDGIVKPSKSHDPKDIVEAVDGIKLGTRHLEEAYKGGILTAITAPMSRNVIEGISAAFKTSADTLLSEGSLVSPAVALHLQIGDNVKSDSFPTVSSQIAYIRQVLTEHAEASNYFGKAARGEIPTIIRVHNKDEIASIVALKQQHFPNARFAILGGAESHLVASHLAEANIPVILSPTLCTPQQFDSIHCMTGAPLTDGLAAHVLHRHGVKIGLGVADDGLARNLAWDAGWLAATSPEGDITEPEAIRFVTTNLQEIFGLARSKATTEDNNSNSIDDEFVVWSGNPLRLHTKPLFFYSKKQGIQVP